MMTWLRAGSAPTARGALVAAIAFLVAAGIAAGGLERAVVRTLADRSSRAEARTWEASEARPATAPD